MGRPRQTPGWGALTLFAVAMAFLESAVVVYLRLLYYPEGFRLPLRLIEPWVVAIEVGREAASLVMLVSVAWIAGSDRWGRFLGFCYLFGVWDICYYVWLWVFLRWPPSLMTWDVLFLIPVPWCGPVLAPVLVSLALIVGAVALGRLHRRRIVPGFRAWQWALACAGGALVLAAFMADYRIVVAGGMPPPFRWWLFGAGLGLAVVAAGFGVNSRTSRPHRAG